MAAPGSFSDGLRTKVLPQVTARGNIQRGIMAGKLKGAMPAHTPSGSRKLTVSMSRLTLATVDPIMCVAMPHACSTTSRPRCTSPLASARVLPCSSVMDRARTSMFCLIRCCKLNMTRARAITGVSLQDSRADCAACTACSISSTGVSGRRDTTDWVAGLMMSKCCLALEVTRAPPMKSFVTGGGSSLWATFAEAAPERRTRG
mmetsp:Transcript_21293/g.36560  ORF Transcript_21293/g.36560 Transcript_21293/m.36560 type:complete len:203 (+) Transcript_21293:1607-2215(+)